MSLFQGSYILGDVSVDDTSLNDAFDELNEEKDQLVRIKISIRR